jgi:hypothetical protein
VAVYSHEERALLQTLVNVVDGAGWLRDDSEGVADYLYQLVTRALPEGLLGFFSAARELTGEVALRRLRLAAAVAYLAREGGTAVASLEQEELSTWLGLGAVDAQSARLLIARTGPATKWAVVEVDVDASASTSGTLTRAAAEARLAKSRDQLNRALTAEPPDLISCTARELLRRHLLGAAVGLEVDRLALADAVDAGGPVTAQLVTFADVPEPMSQSGVTVDAVTTMPRHWLQSQVSLQPGANVEVPSYLLDEFEDVLADD